MSSNVGFLTMWYVRPAQAQTRLRVSTGSDQPEHTRSLIRAFASRVIIL